MCFQGSIEPSAKARAVEKVAAAAAAAQTAAGEASSTTATELILPAFCSVLRSFWSEMNTVVSYHF
jgi:hypothetical protein